MSFAAAGGSQWLRFSLEYLPGRYGGSEDLRGEPVGGLAELDAGSRGPNMDETEEDGEMVILTDCPSDSCGSRLAVRPNVGTP